MMTPEQVRLEVTRFVAMWMLVYPEDADRGPDVLRRTAARRVLARQRRGEPPLSQLSTWPEPER